MSKNGTLVSPYGGKLVNLVTTGEEREMLRGACCRGASSREP